MRWRPHVCWPAAAQVESVHYPGLATIRTMRWRRGSSASRFGSIVSFTLRGGTAAAAAFMAAAPQIPFCPSLGELNTTLSHPESTSHRALSTPARQALGIAGGTIRLSVGIESPQAVVAAIEQGLAGVRSP